MPTYNLTSPTTGRSYQATFDRDPSHADMEAAVAHADKQFFDAHDVSPEIAKQGPVGTALMSVPQTFGKVGTGMVGGTARILDKAGQMVGLPGGGLLQDVAEGSDALQEEASRTYPTNPLNRKAAVVGSGAAQGLSLLAGGALGKAMGMGNGVLTTLPLVSGGLTGANDGIQKAEDIGVQSPAGQLAMGLLFGGVEAGTEKLGGFGNKAATDAMLAMWRKPAAEMLKQAAKNIGVESGEEVIAGSAQDLLTRAFAMEDPQRPGYTTTGVELPKMDRRMLEQRGLEALGGAAGGTIFAGAGVAHNFAAPVAPQAVEGQPLARTFTRSDGQQFTVNFESEPGAEDLAAVQMQIDGQAPGGAPVESELARIAQRAGMEDSPMQSPALPPGASVPADGTNAPESPVPPAAANVAPDAAADPNAGPAATAPAADTAAAPDDVSLGAGGDSRVMASRPFPTQGLLSQALAVATGQQGVTTPAGMQALLNANAPGMAQTPGRGKGVGKYFEMPANTTPQAPENGELGDVMSMSPANIDWALTHLDGENRQRALGVGRGHYGKAETARGWYEHLVKRVRSADALAELNNMYAELRPGAKLQQRALPATQMRLGDVESMTPQQAAWVLKNTDGRERQALLGVTPEHYSDAALANGWGAHLAALAGHDTEALHELKLIHGEMLPETAQTHSGLQPQVLEAAHAVASRGSGTAMVPLGTVYAQAAQMQPGLTPEAFLQGVQEADGQGHVMLEPANTQEEMNQAQGWVVPSQSGPAIRMTMAPPRVSMSRPKPSPMQRLAQWWQSYVKTGNAQRRGAASEKKGLAGIVADYGKPGEATVEEQDTQGKVPGVKRMFRLHLKDDNGRPLTALMIESTDGFVHVDTTGMEAKAAPRGEQRTKARGGDLVYQAALTFAHNNGLKFRPDPEGVSSIAHLRRLGHLLSSALRHGTTRHISPHHRKAEHADVPADWWRSDDSPEAHAHNVAVLAEMEKLGIERAAAQRGVNYRGLRYDPATDTIRDETGRSLSRRDVEDTLARLDPARSGVGETAFLRGLVSQSALQGHELARLTGMDESGGDVGTRDAKAAGGGGAVLRNDGDAFRVLHRGQSLLSRKPDAGEAAGRVSPEAAAQALNMLKVTAPWLAQGVTVVQNRGQLRQGDYHPQDWDSFAGPSATEAFFDPVTGGVVVLLDNLQVRKGETPRRAVVRAILHERIGHAGLAALRANNPEFAKRWERLVEEIQNDAQSADEIAALRDQGYGHLSDSELVEEWFARKVEAMTPEELQALQPKSTLGRLWQWLKDALVSVTRSLPRGGSWTEQQLKEIMALSRQALEQGQTAAAGGRVKQSMRLNPFHGSGVPNWLRSRLNLLRNAPFRVQNLGLRALIKGTALPAELLPFVQRSQRDIAAVNETAAQLGRDLNGAIDAYAARSGTTVQATHDLVARAMEDPALLQAMADPVLQERTRRARNFLDDMSQAVATFTGGELGQAILQNRGHWMRRFYAAFDPAANWSYDSLEAAARRGGQIAGVNARQILDAARAHITQSVNAQRAAQGGPAVTPGEVEAMMRQLTDRGTWERNLLGNMAGSGVSKDVTSLMQRAAYHPDVAQWMRNNRLTEWDYQTVAALAATGGTYQGHRAAHLLGAARGYLMGLPAHANASQGEINDMLRMRDIPAPLRALMGEERNPVKRFMGSASFQSQFIARHEQQMGMRDLGLTMGLFSPTQTGVYTEEVGDSRERNGFQMQVQVPGPNGQPVTVPRVIYTTPELAAALRATQGSSSPADLGGRLLEALKFAGSEAKLNKVALNPDSWMVNALGNLMGLVQSGDLLAIQGWQNVARAIELHRSGQMKSGEMLNAAQEAEQDLRRQMLARLTAAGVANAGFELSDLNAALDNRVTQFINEHDHWNTMTGGLRGAILGNGVGRSFGLAGRVVGAALGAAGGARVGSQRIQEVQRRIAAWTTGNPDRIAKLAAFYGNYEAHLAAGMAEPDAFALATEKTMNTLPDYSQLPDFMRQLSRLGLAGSFIGFQHEVYRNAWHNARYAVQELRSGSAPLVARGMRRMVGLSSLLTLAAWGLSSIIRGAFSSGVDDEKDRAYRRALGANHERFGNLAYTKLDKDGASFFNTSYLLPQVTLFEVIKAGIEGRNLGETLGNLAGQLSDQFIEGSVHLDPLLSAWANKTDFGKVSEEQGARNVMDRMDYLLYNMMEPGALNKGDRVVRALTGQSRYGRTFSVEEELLRLLGVRQNSYTHEKRISSRMFRFRDEYASARAAARKVFSERPNSGAATDALARSNARIEELQKDWEQFQQDLKMIGVPGAEIERIRKATGAARTFPKLEMGDKGPESERARTVKLDRAPSGTEEKATGVVGVRR